LSAQPERGNLGAVVRIVCEAYAGVGFLIPRYTVQCNEPGLPQTGESLHQVVQSAG